MPDDLAASFREDSLGMSLGRPGHFVEPSEWSIGTTRGYHEVSFQCRDTLRTVPGHPEHSAGTP